MKKWLFFDLGSTLLDESDCTEYRILDMLKQENAPSRTAIVQKMKECAFKGKMPYKDTAREFGLETIQWPTHLEKMYKGVPKILEQLQNKYWLGIIANQSEGTEERLIKFGIRDYFKVILSSAEEGVAKPDLEIYRRALERAECIPENAYMIGDRLDNDIEPAAKLGMSTIWVKQGTFAYTNLDMFCYKPDIIVEHIGEILEYL
ncbi:MAG: HAD family hydrolase [Lachnospiraceae bacterium]|nr:HAD family hydrolase [Lachnospiraceae bacterium]